jgi:2-oxoglutarate dehydrogenase E1 component
MDSLSYLGNGEIEAIENLYKQYIQNPASVEKEWQRFFQGFEFAKNSFNSEKPEILDKEFKVISLIDEYRKRGHFFTKTNPVRTRRKYYPTLDIENFKLSEIDKTTVFQAGNEIGIGPAPLTKIVEHLQQTYCQSFGAEFMYIRTPEKVEWLTKKMESSRNMPNFSVEEKKKIHSYMVQASGFERFIHNKFVGQKRFSLEGSESIIPALHNIIEHGAKLGIEEFVIGMSHRGRLNVLTNILEKPYEKVFKEFIANKYEENIVLGDVKYHLGFDNEVPTNTGKQVKLKLAPNPSHLETVGPIIQGIAYSEIKFKYNNDENKLCPILIHGDAAIATQGVVYEVIQLAELDGYRTGGTIHLVINNQVGFTTNYLEARSSIYCTDVAKVTKSPVFHINGDDVEAVVLAIRMAMEYRQTFHSDVFIDILSYRKHGHNEGDEPRFTQPLLYKIIEKHPNPRDIYSKKLIEQGIYTEEQTKSLEAAFDSLLEEKFNESKKIDRLHIKQFMEEDWKGFRYTTDADFVASPETGISKVAFKNVTEAMNNLPSDKKFFSKTLKLIEDRKNLIAAGKVDWALAEQIAFGSLIIEGHPVRVSGQDSMRGTFAHRHAGHVMEDTDQKYFPLKKLDTEKADFTILNSPLTEYGVLGFEYGYALATPTGLNIWEAQFGDFHNVAQVIIDQYLSSAEEKWGIMNGLTLLLPHGYEGQGPEHSHARIERFLTLCANNNMQIVNCTTPANFFHALRRQVKRDFRIPMVVFTPKSLLRSPKMISTIEELEYGHFQEVYDDNNVDVNEVRRLVFCSGKVYFDLLEKKNEFDAKDIALIRVEQLHPFPMEKINAIFDKYKNALIKLWVQEEPENMGPWMYVNYKLKDRHLVPVTRQASGSPAVGLNELHQMEQKEIIAKVFRHCDCEHKSKYCGLQCVAGKSHIEIMKQHNYLYSDKPLTTI